MTIITEDGTAKVDSETYISVDDADLYHSKHGITLWATLTTPYKEQALRRATDYMTGVYRARWKGRRFLTTQALDWPRVGVVIDDEPGLRVYSSTLIPYTVIPKEVKNACAELALRATMGPLADDVSQKVLSETVGPLKVVYDKDSSVAIQYRQIDMTLQPYLLRGSSSPMVKLVRT